MGSTDLINRKDQGAEARRMVLKDVLPFIGDLNIKDVRKGHITEITDRLLQRGVNRMAKGCPQPYSSDVPFCRHSRSSRIRPNSFAQQEKHWWSKCRKRSSP